MSVMLKVIIEKFDVKTYEDLTQIIEMLLEIAVEAKELAGYAAFAEHFGGITINKDKVKKHCDQLFGLNQKLVEKVAKSSGSDETYEEGIRRIVKEGHDMWARESLDEPEEVEAPPLVVGDILKKSRR